MMRWTVKRDGRDSLTDKLRVHNLWSVDGETDGRDSLLTNSMQNIGQQV